VSEPSLDLSAVHTLFDALPPDAEVHLDPADPVHRAGIEAALAASGRHKERYPHLHSTLGQAAAGKTGLALVDKGADRSGRATAMSWQSSGRGHVFSGGTVFAMDGASGDLLALGHNSNVGEGFVQVSTDTASAKPADKALKVLAVHHSVAQDGTAAFAATASQAMLGEALATIDVVEPTTTPAYPPNVRIALGRTSTSQDVDYWYAEPQNVQTPYLIVPFMGNAVLPYNIDGSIGQAISGAVYDTKIYFVTNSGSDTVELNTTYTTDFTGKVTVGPDSQNQVTWNYPYGAGGSYTQTSSLVYDPQSLVNETVSYFFYSFQIPVLNAPTPTLSFAVCSTDTPNEPSFQCQKIPNLWFWWHCLAEGTEVTMEDGSVMAIEKIDNTMRVRADASGGDLGVEATTRGGHQSSAAPLSDHTVFRLTTEGGHHLTATGAHLIATPEGLVALSTLKQGVSVLTGDGPVAVTACEAVDFDGVMYNLKLGDATDRSNGLSDAATCTFLAGGIVVGDKFAQRNAARARARDIDHMRSVLPDHLHDDYASAIEDIRY